MKNSLYVRYILGVGIMTLVAACNTNNQETKQLDTIYEHTDPDGHPLDNRDTIVEYKEMDSIKSDTTLRGDKH